jgi:hypothetical protein
MLSEIAGGGSSSSGGGGGTGSVGSGIVSATLLACVSLVSRNRAVAPMDADRDRDVGLGSSSSSSSSNSNNNNNNNNNALSRAGGSPVPMSPLLARQGSIGNPGARESAGWCVTVRLADGSAHLDVTFLGSLAIECVRLRPGHVVLVDGVWTTAAGDAYCSADRGGRVTDFARSLAVLNSAFLFGAVRSTVGEVAAAVRRGLAGTWALSAWLETADPRPAARWGHAVCLTALPRQGAVCPVCGGAPVPIVECVDVSSRGGVICDGAASLAVRIAAPVDASFPGGRRADGCINTELLWLVVADGGSGEQQVTATAVAERNVSGLLSSAVRN